MGLQLKVTNDYDNWSLTNWDHTSSKIYKIRYTKGGVNCVATKDFTLTTIPEDIYVTVVTEALPEGDGDVSLTISLVTPDLTTVVLFTHDGEFSGYALNRESILSHLTGTGVYTLILQATLSVANIGSAYAEYTTVQVLTDRAPENLVVTNYSQTFVDLDWDDDADADSYNVYWNGDDDSTTSSEYLVEGLERDTEYTFSVTSVNTYGESLPAEVVQSTKPLEELVLEE